MKAVVVTRDSRAVQLTLDCPTPESNALELGGVIFSLVRSSGIPETAFIDLEATGIPSAFAGDTWRAEWNRLGAKRELRIGFPDTLFAGEFDAPVRIQIDAVSKDASNVLLGSLAIDVAAPLMHDNREWPAWAPALAD